MYTWFIIVIKTSGLIHMVDHMNMIHKWIQIVFHRDYFHYQVGVSELGLGSGGAEVGKITHQSAPLSIATPFEQWLLNPC